MNIALFGGTFDPIHSGHLRAAQAAAKKFRLDRILFMPSGNPPHKRQGRVTPFIHRFAMVSLACAGEPKFIPSLAEAPSADGAPQYSIDTVRRLKKTLGVSHRLYFLMGLDAFLDMPQWKQPERLLDIANFIVVSRPGFRMENVLNALPARDAAIHRRPGLTTLTLRRTRIYILDRVHASIASSELREKMRRGRPVTGLIPALVEEYIMKKEIYKARERRGSQS